MSLRVSHLSTSKTTLGAAGTSPSGNGGAFALQDINFTLKPGERLAVVGSNGSGKSTLLRALLGLVDLQGGTVVFDDGCGARGDVSAAGKAEGPVARDGMHGADSSVPKNGGQGHSSPGYTLQPTSVRADSGQGRPSRSCMSRPTSVSANPGQGRCEHLTDFAYVPQDPEAGFVCTSVFDEVAFGLCNLGLPPRQIEARVRDALQNCGIEELSGRNVSQLSGGQKQLTSIASALALRPRVLLLDEPFCMLDDRTVQAVKAALRAGESDMSIIEVTHNLEDVLEFDRLVAMRQGEIAWRGMPATFVSDSALVRSFGVRGVCGDSSVSLTDMRGADYTPAPAPEAGTGLLLCDCSYAYDGQEEGLRGVSLHVNPGELVALVGDSGSGKTTCACLAAGLLKPQSGVVLCDGKSVCPGDVGIAFQRVQDQLFRSTVLDDVMFGPLRKGCGAQDARAKAKTALTAVGLDPTVSGPLNPHLLSGGEKRRVALAGVLAMDTAFVILDEPTLGLDAPGMECLLATVRTLLDQGRGILVITHEPQAFTGLLTRVYRLEKGKSACIEVNPATSSGPEAQAVSDLGRRAADGPGAAGNATGQAPRAGHEGRSICNAAPRRPESGRKHPGCNDGEATLRRPSGVRKPPDVDGGDAAPRVDDRCPQSPKDRGAACPTLAHVSPARSAAPAGASSLNPIAWLLACAVCSVCVLGIDAPLAVAAAWAVALGVFGHVGGSFRRLGKAIGALGLMYALVIVSAALVFDGSADLALVGTVGLTWAGAARGALTVARLMLLVVISLALVHACSSEELMDALRAILAPLGRVGLPVADVCVMLSLALRCIPLTAEQVASIARAQNARGAQVGLPGNPVRKVLSYVPLLAPACIAMFRYAEDFAVALQAKGFTGSRPTALHRRAMTPRDWAVGISVCLCAIAAALFL